MQGEKPKYPYSAYLLDNSGEKIIFFVEGPNKGVILNVTPQISVNIEESRLTPAPIKCVIRGGV